MKELVNYLHKVAKEATNDIMYELQMGKPSKGITITKNL